MVPNSSRFSGTSDMPSATRCSTGMRLRSAPGSGWHRGRARFAAKVPPRALSKGGLARSVGADDGDDFTGQYRRCTSCKAATLPYSACKPCTSSTGAAGTTDSDTLLIRPQIRFQHSRVLLHLGWHALGNQGPEFP